MPHPRKQQRAKRAAPKKNGLLRFSGVPRYRCTIKAPPAPPAGVRLGPPPSHRLSDALTQVMEPFVQPPVPETLEAFFDAISFGAQVWNVTNTATSGNEVLTQLSRLVEQSFDPPQRPVALRLAHNIALRKIRLFPHDHRIVINLRLVETDDEPILWAIGAAWT